MSGEGGGGLGAVVDAWATDADLVALEPVVARELAHMGAMTLRGQVTIVGTVLTWVSTQGVAQAAGIGVGSVIVAAGVVVEVVEVPGGSGGGGGGGGGGGSGWSGEELVVSVVRGRGDLVVTPPPAMEEVDAEVVSFRSWRVLAARRMLARAGVDAEDAVGVGGVSARGGMLDVHAHATLALLFRAAGALVAEEHPLNVRAREHERAWERLGERWPLRVEEGGGGGGSDVPPTPRRPRRG
jgi:hypothetical protein